MRGDREEGSLLCPADANFTGNGMYFDASAAAAQASPQRMFSLLFDDNGDIGTNLAGNCLGGQMKVRRGRDADLHAAGSGSQIPISLFARITLHVDTA